MTQEGDFEPPDPPLDAQQRAIADALTDEQLAQIDRTLLDIVDVRWRRVAYVVATAMNAFENRQPPLPDVFYAERVRAIAQTGAVELEGFVDRMRWCEVRLSARR